MQTKLDQLLDLLNSNELKRFERFVQSPYFNENKTLITLCSLLVPLARKGVEYPEKEEIWNKLHPDKAFSDVKYRRYSSDLYQLAERFLAFELMRERPEQERLLTMQSLNQRSGDQTFKRKMKRLLQTESVRNSDYFFLQYQIEEEEALSLVRERKDHENLQEKNHQLDLFYLARKLQIYCEALNAERIYQTEIPIRLASLLVDQMEGSPYMQEPLIAAYYKVSLTMTSPDEVLHFDDLENLLDSYSASFSPDERRFLFYAAQNYCIRKANRGQREFVERLFAIYKKGMEVEAFFVGKELPYPDYNNIVNVAVRLKEFEWAEEFILKYTSYLPEKHQENALSYKLAHLLFEKKEYDKVIEHLAKVRFDDVYSAIGTRWLMLKTYYEQQEYLALETLIVSFRIYLRRATRLEKKRQKHYLQTLRVIKKIVNANPNDKDSIRKLRAEIAEKEIHSKTWILAKVDEML